jgi:penicillin-binding protein 2
VFIRDLIPSMFHRRLLLLAAILILPLGMLVVQMSRLTLVYGDQLRDQAEERLIERRWSPTVRGRILDRKGRILAYDRPSYSVTVDHGVIAGEWVSQAALSAARHVAGHSWIEMNAKQRQDMVNLLLPVYHDHTSRAWNLLAERTGLTRQELDRRRDVIIEQVQRKLASAVRQRVQNAMRDAVDRNDEPAQEIIEPLLAGLAEMNADQVRDRILTRLNDARATGDTVAQVTLTSILKSTRQRIYEQDSRHPLTLPSEPFADSDAFSLDLLSQRTIAPDRTLFPSEIDSIEDLPEVPLIPGLRVLDAGSREYPYESVEVELDRTSLPSPMKREDRALLTVRGVACHILGRMRDRVFAEDAGARREFLDRNPEAQTVSVNAVGDDRGAYREGDRVGESGIEGSQEHFLRGLRGMQILHRDTGEIENLPPAKGADVTLSLDIMLQARVQAAMSQDLGLATVQAWHHQESATQPVGTGLNGAAVVLDVDTGDILAMVSTPTYTREQVRDNPEQVFDDKIRMPWLNRAIAKPYPPGSIVKALVLTEALTRGVFSGGQRIACTGHLLEGKPNLYRCWIYKRFQTTHSVQLGHDLTADEGIMCSCNIFFFTLGRRLDVSGMVETYRDFGVGAPFALGVGIESPGNIGFIEAGTNRSPDDGSDLEPPDAIQMGIGQGPIAWTPLHAANAYASLARRGVRYAPRLILGAPRPEPIDLDLSQEAIDLALEGLRKSVNEELGTGNHLSIDGKNEPIFNVPGITIWGKTGTAEAPDVFVDPDEAGPRRMTLAQEGDHSWFVVLAGKDRPKYVVSVIVEYGGSGGKVSGPICNQILHALSAEGYFE